MAPSKNLYVAEADMPIWERAERHASESRQSVSKVVTAALQQYLSSAEAAGGIRRLVSELGAEPIEVQVGERGIKTGFEGRWLVEPDPDATSGTRTRMDGYDAGAYYGVALTKRGRIAAYVAHCNDGFPPELKDYDDLDDAAEMIPEDILAEAAEAMGQERVVWRDI